MNRQFEHVKIVRDCEAIAIPAGLTVTLLAGSDVTITQALGGSYSVNYQGQLLRIAEKDADALGKTSKLAKTKSADRKKASPVKSGDVDQSEVLAVLKTCYDPEIPINIVDLGLVYHIDCYHLANNKNEIRIIMTLTAAGCGMGSVLAEDVKQKVLTVPDVDSVNVKIVYDPPWSLEMISEVAKFKLGLI